MSFMSNFGKRLIEARQRQANAQVRSILSRMDEKSLKRLGVDREELENIF